MHRYSNMQFTVSCSLASLLRTVYGMRCLKLSLLITGVYLMLFMFLICTGGVRSCNLRVTLRHLWSEMSSMKSSLRVDSMTFMFLTNI